MPVFYTGKLRHGQGESRGPGHTGRRWQNQDTWLRVRALRPETRGGVRSFAVPPAHARPAGAGDLPAPTQSHSRTTAASPPAAASAVMRCRRPHPNSLYPNGLWVPSTVFPPSPSWAVRCFYQQAHLLLVKVCWVRTCGHTIMEGLTHLLFGVVSNFLLL